MDGDDEDRVGWTDQVPFMVPDITEDDIAAVTAVLRSRWLTTGREGDAFERDLSAYLGGPSVVAMSSCTAALEVSFAWLDLPPGALVGVPAWTFAASALAPMRLGGVPVLLDVDPDSGNVATDAVAAAVDGGLDALVVVHVGGVPVDPEVRALAAEAGVPVVEDLAHGLGAADDRGRISGQGTTAACLSFYATKNLTTAEGGALVTHDPDLAQFARTFRLHGMSRDAWARRQPEGAGDYDLVMPGIKANLPDVLAALGRSQLRRFDGLQARRAEVEARYRTGLAGSPIRLAPSRPVPGSAHHLVVVVLPEGVDRRGVVAQLARAGIGTSVHYRPLHQLSWLAGRVEIGPAGVAAAEALTGRVLSLPQYPGLPLETVDRICAELRAAVAG